MPTSVNICVATYNRPEGLRQLLNSLEELVFPGIELPAVTVVVLDNSPDRSACDVVVAASAGSRWTIRYVHVPRRGISHARNAALEHSSGADFIAFIDDDEVAEPDWLEQLLVVQAECDADVVAGPVIPRFQGKVAHWIEVGGFFDPPQYPDRTQIPVAYTGSVLIRNAMVQRERLRFDEHVASIGGEDVLFFARVRLAGYSIYWAARSIAYETVGEARTNLRWLLKRWFRTGNVEALLVRSQNPAAKAFLLNFCRGLMRVAAGFPAFLISSPAVVLGKVHVAVRPLYTVARGLGMLSSSFNLHYKEYESSSYH